MYFTENIDFLQYKTLECVNLDARGINSFKKKHFICIGCFSYNNQLFDLRQTRYTSTDFEDDYFTFPTKNV